LLRASVTDADAFRVVYDRHAHEVFAWLRAQVKDDDVAADVLAETFAQAWLCARRFRDERDGSARPWLFGIARHILLESYRKERVETRARRRLGLNVRQVETDVSDEIIERLDAQAQRDEIEDALQRLPRDQRRAIELRVLTELPYASVASVMNSSEPYARMRVMRGLGKLRRVLGSNGSR
jgi:RNA polymerase sigma-70 factor (ECF subfamily)